MLVPHHGVLQLGDCRTQMAIYLFDVHRGSFQSLIDLVPDLGHLLLSKRAVQSVFVGLRRGSGRNDVDESVRISWTRLVL